MLLNSGDGSVLGGCWRILACFSPLRRALAVFEIRKAVDKETGREIEPVVATNAGGACRSSDAVPV